MKARFFTLIMFLIIPILIFSQCPGTTAISYKNKAKNLGPQEFSKQQAYIWLATYYAYKCECETGSPLSQQLVGMINGIVDTYSAYTKNAYGSISKVSTCKAENGTGNSESTGETGDPNAGNHGSGITLEPKKNFLETLMSDLGMNEADLQNILSGNFEGAIKNMKYNQDINSISNLTGGNTEIASGLYNLAELLGKELNKPKTPVQLKILFDKKLNKEKGNSYWANDTLISMSNTNDSGDKIVSYQYKGAIANKTQKYDLNGELKSETIYLSNKEWVNIDYLSKSKKQILANNDGRIIKETDLISGVVLIDETKNTSVNIFNDKGKKTGEQILKEGKLYQEIFLNKEKEIFTYNQGIKIRHEYFSHKGLYKTIPSKIVNYDLKNNIISVFTTEYKKRKLREKEILYKNGLPFLEKIHENGALISEKEL